MFSWTGEGGGTEELRWEPWTDTSPNQMGLCAAFTLLPHGAVPPLRLSAEAPDP